MLRKTGETISERTVGQYMKQMGIKAQWVKPWTITTRDSDFSSKLQNILEIPISSGKYVQKSLILWAFSRSMKSKKDLDQHFYTNLGLFL